MESGDSDGRGQDDSFSDCTIVIVIGGCPLIIIDDDGDNTIAGLGNERSSHCRVRIQMAVFHTSSLIAVRR